MEEDLNKYLSSHLLDNTQMLYICLDDQYEKILKVEVVGSKSNSTM